MVAPKPQSLCATVAEHHSALEADLARFYPGTDLLDLWRGRLSWRRLAQLIRWLPPDAALYQSMRMARPPKPATGDGAALVLNDRLDAARYGTLPHLAELMLAMLQRLEAYDYARSDPAKRGEFTPTLPPGYSLTAAAAANPELLAAYFAAMRPPTDRPEV